MNSNINLCKNLKVNISKSEFNRFALKYGVFNDKKTCTIHISSRDFETVGQKGHSLTIRLTRSDFVNVFPKTNDEYGRNKTKTSEKTKASVPQNQKIQGKKGERVVESTSTQPTKQTRALTVVQEEPIAMIIPASREHLMSQDEIEAQKTRYDFRERKRAADDSFLHPPAKRTRTLTVARNEPIPKFKVAPRNALISGQVVLAKMHSFSAWPAFILSFRKTCVDIQFFGDDTTGTVPYNGIGLFEENHRLIICNLKKKIRGYEKAVHAAEITLEIAPKYSILNKV